MNELLYFDACCYLGRHVHKPEGQPETAEEILAAMDHFGIHEALVVDTLSRETNPMAGNRRIIERTRAHPRLHPAWAALMPQSRELPPPREFVAQLREAGVGAVFLFYGQFDIRLEDWGIDPLLEELAAVRCPVVLCPVNWREGGHQDATDWHNVVRICRKFPDLPVIVTEARVYKSQRAVWAALAACPNLKIDLSALWLARSIEFVCREFGADRLVWGSQLPERTPGAPLMQLNYSLIRKDELALIAGGTMRKLLSWNPKIRFVGESVKLSPPSDSIHRAARECTGALDGTPLAGERFYDCHGHIGWATPHHVTWHKLEELVREMDLFGVQVCCVFGLEGVFGDETYGNDEVADAVRRFPNRFIGFTMVNPNHGERAMREELERGLAMGMKGIKLIAWYQGYPTEGPLIDVACEFAHRHRQFILNHSWGSAAQMERLCKTYPDACFFAGHTTREYAQLVKRVDNLFICTCPLLGWHQTEEYVELYGADRLLFGSDLTDLPIGWGMGQIAYANIPEADKRLILGGNLKRLMDKYGIRPGP